MPLWLETAPVALCATLLAACAPQGRPASEGIGESEPGVPYEPPSAAAPSAAGSAVPPAAAASAASSAPPDDGRVALESDFPPDTRSLKVTDTSHVLVAPSERARYIGKVVGGTRVAWKRVVAPDPPDPTKPKRRERCTSWVEIEPRGFVCRTALAPSLDEPRGVHQPVVPSGRLTPDDYFKVMADETKVYKTADDVRADTVDQLVSKKVMLVGQGVLHVDETPYMKTDHGLVEAAALARFWPSDFAGVKLGADGAPSLPFAWVFFEHGARRPPVYPSPSAEGKPVRDARRREIVSLLEETNGFVRIGDGEWIERKHLREAAPSKPPAGVPDDAQWIDVDLDEQVLVAYEGGAPVFATLVSSGGRKNPTPPATYRVRAKAATTDMTGDPNVPNRYEVSGVPWAVRFADGFYIHGVYWHDGFGAPRSHGCVNVSPKDAAFIFDWVNPVVPDGWSEVEVPSGEGIVVRLRDKKNEDPPPFDYSAEERKGQKLRTANRF